LDGRSARAAVPHGRTRSPHANGVTASAGQKRGDVEFRSYLRDAAGPRSLVFDLITTHDRFGSSSHVKKKGVKWVIDPKIQLLYLQMNCRNRRAGERANGRTDALRAGCIRAVQAAPCF
jgi:hypothetical protein